MKAIIRTIGFIVFASCEKLAAEAKSMFGALAGTMKEPERATKILIDEDPEEIRKLQEN